MRAMVFLSLCALLACCGLANRAALEEGCLTKAAAAAAGGNGAVVDDDDWGAGSVERQCVRLRSAGWLDGSWPVAVELRWVELGWRDAGRH